MDAPTLSSYWVKFFKNAGFPTEHATRHALIFSNNRIKPDMLPDLDKPSLKEMGITLMGDMIAILRYAKKVVEETTCKKFLVSSEDNSTAISKVVAKPIVKKVVTKTVGKTSMSSKGKPDVPVKIVKTAASSIIKPTANLKKKVASSPMVHSKLYSDYIDNNQKPKVNPLKRKYESEEDDSEGKWKRNEELQKRLKALSDDDDDEDDVEQLKFKVLASKGKAGKSQNVVKKPVEQKKTVFHRLGDSMVSSTTSNVESSNPSYNPTFKVTGIGKERNTASSVFNRLGNKDNETPYNRHMRNGSGVTTATPGILKLRTPLSGTKIITTRNQGTKVITTKAAVKRPVGTMRADEEANKKAVSESVRQLVRTTKSLKFNDSPARTNSLPARKLSISSKLASERITVPAKSRLGVSKQVTFNKMATINHIKKQGVFSRLGV